MIATVPRSALAFAFVLLALLATGAVAQTQGARLGPQVALVAPDRPAPGDRVTLEATGLSDVDHAVRVEAPDGSETITVATAVGGRLGVDITLRQAGRHIVWLEGPDIEARFTVTVTAGLPAAGTPPTRPEAPPAIAPDVAPAGPLQAPAASLRSFAVDANTVTALENDGRVAWRTSFAPASGTTTSATFHRGGVWVAHGHQVLELDPDDGRVLARVATSGTVIELRPTGTGLVVVSEVSAPGAPLTVEARLEAGRLIPPALFDPENRDLFDALMREAEVGDPVARLAIDRTNPYLHLWAAIVAPTEAERVLETEIAIESATTFYDLARLARLFASEGWWAEADTAMAAAAVDFAARGYDPALLTSTAVHERYGFPLRPLRRALAAGDLVEARLWAPWLYALSGPDLPGIGTELRAFATALTNHGDRELAVAWRELAGERSNPSASEVLARNALVLGRSGTVASASLMLAFFILHLVLIVKYQRAQDLALRQKLEAGRRPLPWPRLRAIRFYGLTEKMVLAIILALAYATVVLVGWTARGDVRVAAAAAGHLESPTAAALWSSVTHVAGAGDAASLAWLRAYRADRAGQPELAREALVAQDDASLDIVRSALAQGDPVPTPSPVTLRAAAAGTWYGFVGAAFWQPQLLLDDHLVLLGLPAWSWPAQLLLFWLVALWHLAWLVLPRPRYAADAPRPLLYELLALLVPGSGQADELYGVLLIVPWALFGIDALTQLLGGASPLGIPIGAGLVVLSVLYAVNLLAWAIEFASVRKRLARLRATQPELARSFGLKPLPAASAQELDRA